MNSESCIWEADRREPEAWEHGSRRQPELELPVFPDNTEVRREDFFPQTLSQIPDRNQNQHTVEFGWSRSKPQPVTPDNRPQHPGMDGGRLPPLWRPLLQGEDNLTDCGASCALGLRIRLLCYFGIFSCTFVEKAGCHTWLCYPWVQNVGCTEVNMCQHRGPGLWWRAAKLAGTSWP